MWRKSILAGLSIAMGCVLYMLIEDKVVGAICFSIGLLNIRISNYLLFTGQTQLLLYKECTIKELCKILIGNLIGVAILFGLCMLLTWKDQRIFHMARKIGMAKVQTDLLYTFLKAICCGVVMTIATKKTTPLFISVLCVAAFILAGLNHCIADFFYLLGTVFTPRALFVFPVIVLGNFIGGFAGSLISIEKTPME